MSGRCNYWGYLLAFFVAIALCSAGMFFLCGTDWFSKHDNYPALRSLGYNVRAHHLNCEVLLWGDSAALTGLDPKVITSETGLTACNSSEGLTTQLVVGSDEPLRAYLEQNDPPRIIVGLWSYASLRPDVPPHTTYTPEGMYYALRYSNRWQFVRMLLFSGHPHWVTRYLLWAASRLSLTDTSVQGWDPEEIRAKAGGMFQFPSPPQKTCTRNMPIFGGEAIQAWPQSVANFRAKYIGPRTKVLVDVSPIPDCNQYVEIYREKTAGLHDNPFCVVPIGYFNEGDLHFSPEGSHFISEQVADQIKVALHL